MNGSMKGWKGTDQVKNLSENLWSPIFPFFFPFFPSPSLFFSDSGTDDSKKKIYIYIYVCKHNIFIICACTRTHCNRNEQIGVERRMQAHSKRRGSQPRVVSFDSSFPFSERFVLLHLKKNQEATFCTDSSFSN